MFLNIASPSSLYKQYLFYYNFLKDDKEENYQRLHKPLLHRMLLWLHQITLLSFLSKRAFICIFYPRVFLVRIFLYLD